MQRGYVFYYNNAQVPLYFRIIKCHISREIFDQSSEYVFLFQVSDTIQNVFAVTENVK